MPTALTIRQIEGKPGSVYYPLELTTIPSSQPSPTQVVIRITHCALNHRDLFIRQHLYPGTTFGVPLFDLSSFDVDQINKEYLDTKTATARRVLPLHRRGNRIFVATSDPTNLQALEEVRFKTNLIVESVVVEDDKLAQAIHKLVESSGTTLQELASMDELEVDLAAGEVRDLTTGAVIPFVPLPPAAP